MTLQTQFLIKIHPPCSTFPTPSVLKSRDGGLASGSSTFFFYCHSQIRFS